MTVNRKKGKVISVETALQITQAVLSALKATHAAHIVHRDIKPANIFICKDGTIKVIDFGAARFSDSDTEKTRTIIITPGYAPAEQYQSKSKQGPYTDIYAVGAVLYEMLTGIKPDESINRKVEDNVEIPEKLNPNVPSYLNSAVMRAMAIQPEIRFQNVTQFSKALQSEKEVRDEKKEIKFRKRRRLMRIAVLMLLIVSSGIFCAFQYQTLSKETVLKQALLSIWVPYKEGETKEEVQQLIQNMADEYLRNNESISIEVEAIAENSYEEKLRTSLIEGNGPVLFDSSCLKREDYEMLASLNDLIVFSSLDPNNYYFLDQYLSYFPSEKQLPLTFEIPILYVNSLNESENSMVKQGSYKEFTDQEVSAYLGMVEDYKQVQSDMPGIYSLEMPEDTEGMAGKFTNLWSINADAKEEEYIAAVRLLYYFLSETSQDYLTVQSDHHLPINKNVLQAFVEVNGDFSGLEEYIRKLTMEGEKEE